MSDPGPAAAAPADAWRGIPWMLATMVLFAGINATAKYLTEFYPVPQVVWARYAFHLLAVILLLGRRLPAVMATRRLRLHLGRSVLLLLTTNLYFSGLYFLALADATAMMFVAPLLVTALSIPLLGETVGWRRWAGVAVGFAGALIIIRPGMGVMQTAILLPLVAATVHAVYQIATRSLGRTDSALTIIAYTPLVGALVASAVAPFFWTAPDAKGWALMVLLGGIGRHRALRPDQGFQGGTGVGGGALRLYPPDLGHRFRVRHLGRPAQLGHRIGGRRHRRQRHLHLPSRAPPPRAGAPARTPRLGLDLEHYPGIRLQSGPCEPPPPPFRPCSA